MKRVFTESDSFPFDICTNSMGPDEKSITHTLGADPEIIVTSTSALTVPERIDIVRIIYREGTSPLSLGQFPDEKATMAYTLARDDALVRKCYGRVKNREIILVIVEDKTPLETGKEKEMVVSKDQRFIIFSAGWNSEEYVGKHIRSITRQNYSNYLHIIVDDATTDKTSKMIKHFAHPKMVAYRNEKNMKWVYNALKYIPRHVESDEDVIVVVDMDDWLTSKRVLSILANAYEKRKCWITYGSYVYNTHIGLPSPKREKIYLPQTIKDRTFRKARWMWWHPKTFKFFLFESIREQDLYAPNGELPLYTYDKAIGFPMLEMTPPEKLYHVPDILYVYNIDNPVRSLRHKKDGGLGKWYREKKQYEVLKR